MEEEKIGFEETELRLGLPGLKRNFSETQSTADLKLNLSPNQKDLLPSATDHHLSKSPAKAQVVGWPPVQSYRKNALAVRKGEGEEAKTGFSGGGLVKVSLDGAAYLRKVDLKMYKSYQDLSLALAAMFPSLNTAGECGSQGALKDFMNADGKLQKDLLIGSEYVPTYEDRDGDWMLVGDVPWEMFVESCKRLRITKRKESVGFAPKAMEKYCKKGD